MLRQRLYLTAVLLASMVWLVRPAAAQIPTNASLTGAYNVRYLGVNVDANNPVDNALSFSGTITFDGKGGFTVAGQGISAATSDHSLKFATSGTYTVLPGGNFVMDNPFDSNKTAALYGGIGAGAVIASGTDTVYTDLFVAVPAATSASTATLSGNYFLGSLEFQNGDFQLTRDTFFSAAADGKGGFGNVTIKGTALNLKSAAQVQTSTGVTYTVSANGAGTLNFPAPSGLATASQLLAGNKVLYVSPDGNFFVAGGATAYDMVVGVKALAGNAATALNGLYFTAYLENYANGGDGDGLYGSQGSATEINSLGVEIANQRTNYEFYDISFDFNISGAFTLLADGTAPSPGFSQTAVGAGGNIVISAGDSTNYQLNVYVKAPSLSGSGVFLNPQGVVNASNNVPFTAAVSPGEVVSLYGTGLSSQTVTTSTLPFPGTVGGVTVNLSWKDSTGKAVTAQAPIYFVSPTLVSAVLPYNIPTDGSFVNFQVNNNGTNSNTVTEYTGLTSPGIFTVPSGGLGNGAILHTDFSLVSAASPAKVGETVQIFLTGLGAVTPAVAAGAAGPSNPLSTMAGIGDLSVFIDNIQAKVLFAGLAPTLGGLYQLNVTIPSGVTLGTSVSIHVQTRDVDNIMATIPISK